MSTNNGVNMIMTPSDILQFREINKEKLAKGNLDDFTRNKLATIIDVSEQVLEQAFLNTVQVVANNNPKFLLPEFLGSDTFTNKVLEEAKKEDTQQTELFKEEPKPIVKTEPEIAVVVGDGYKEQIQAIFKDSKLGLKEKIATALRISSENNDKCYQKAFEEIIALTGNTGVVERIFQMIDKSTQDSIVLTFLRLRDTLNLPEEAAAQIAIACSKRFHPSGYEYLINPPASQIKTWYGNKKIKELVAKLYDNVEVNLNDGQQQKPYFQLLHHIVNMISPEQREKIAARKRKAEYKEKAYPET